MEWWNERSVIEPCAKHEAVITDRFSWAFGIQLRSDQAVGRRNKIYLKAPSAYRKIKNFYEK